MRLVCGRAGPGRAGAGRGTGGAGRGGTSFSQRLESKIIFLEVFLQRLESLLRFFKRFLTNFGRLFGKDYNHNSDFWKVF